MGVGLEADHAKPWGEPGVGLGLRFMWRRGSVPWVGAWERFRRMLVVRQVEIRIRGEGLGLGLGALS